jgi:hypothetical protein
MSTHWSRLEREFEEWSNLTFWQRIKRMASYFLDMLCIPALLILLILQLFAKNVKAVQLLHE